MLDYSLTRSQRKTASITVRDGHVQVRAPLKMPLVNIEEFITSKEGWIREKLVLLREKALHKEAFSLDYGHLIPYRGERYPIVAAEVRCPCFRDGAFCIPPDLPPDKIKSACIQIYRKLAKQDMIPRIHDYAKTMGVQPAQIKITNARTRWGSCTGKGNINLSWRLIKTEDAIIDYIIVHELAHLTLMNHSPQFWALVESFMPDYRERRVRLHKFQKQLAFENWNDG